MRKLSTTFLIVFKLVDKRIAKDGIPLKIKFVGYLFSAEVFYMYFTN